MDEAKIKEMVKKSNARMVKLMGNLEPGKMKPVELKQIEKEQQEFEGQVDDLAMTTRAMAAWFRSGVSIQPANTSGVREYGGKKYVVLENINGILAVYRIKVDGFLKRLKRWPKEIGEGA